MKTLYELKQDLATLGQQIQKQNDTIMQKATDPGTSAEELVQMQKSKDDLQQRFDIIKTQHDQMEAEQKANLSKGQFTTSENPKQKVIDAKAELIRKTIAKEAVPSDVLQVLGDDDASKGGKFLPKTVATDIISEPIVKNPLRDVSAITNIPNLEIPKVSFTLDDDDFIADMETAKELKAKGIQ